MKLTMSFFAMVSFASVRRALAFAPSRTTAGRIVSTASVSLRSIRGPSNFRLLATVPPPEVEVEATTVKEDESLATIRRTAALVMSMAAQRILPGAAATSFDPKWIDNGFYCDFVCSNDDEDLPENVRDIIKKEMDAIIASAEPIQIMSLAEARQQTADSEVSLNGLPDGNDATMVCRIGDEWWDTCDGDGSFLADTGRLDPSALTLTSVCDVHDDDIDDDDKDSKNVQRISATAFECASELLAYKETVAKAQNEVLSFGNLVNFGGSGSLLDLTYDCPCCTYGPLMGGMMAGKGPENAMMSSKRSQTRLTKESGPKIAAVGDRPSLKLQGGFVPAKNPKWLKERELIYSKIKERRDSEMESKPKVPIKVTLPDGTVMTENLISWETTPMDVARSIAEGLANVAVVSKVKYTSRVGEDKEGLTEFSMEYEAVSSEGETASEESKPELWDLNRPLEGDCELQILTFDGGDEDAKMVFWHSSAHILGQSMEHNFGALLTIGPPVAGGFYYDAYIGDSEGISESQFGDIEGEFRASVKRKEKFERLVVTKEEALELFEYSPFKTALIQAKVPDNSRTTVYRNGDLIDLCMGPHVPHTGKIKAFKMLRASATQWLGDINNDPLQRVYGVSFPSKKLLKAHVSNLEKAKERDHRRLGKQQKLFMFHELSPGSAFFLPHGTIIYNTLCDFIKKQYNERGYSEVVTPNVFNLKLWEQSGHAKHYKDDMFTFDVEGEEFGMKPMNCPGHCLMFASTKRSYRELPMRFADFGVLHRNEASGALTGLTRVRRFQQDDGHIFCREDQIESEVVGCLEFMKFVYDIFGMKYQLELSTRPAKALGEQALWDRAESALANAMDDFIGEGNWRENPGDGAFYGPKIDIKVMDAMDRIHQCATIQLDFQLPIRFDLKYRKKGGSNNEDEVIDVESNDSATTTASVDQDGDYENNVLPPDFDRPVMVHRAMLGSVERMFAVLLEHYGGKWPFWLSPRQALVVPVGMDFVPYAQDVRQKLKAQGFHVDVDDSKNSLKKKVREGQLAQYNYILVVGEKERDSESVSVRNRMNEQEGEKKVVEVISDFLALRDTYQ